MDDLVEEFASEVSAGLALLEAALLRREHAADAVAPMLGLVHAIKGTAGFLGLSRVEALAHAVEGALERISRGGATPALIALVLDARDRIAGILAETIAAAAEDRALIAGLDAPGAEAVAWRPRACLPFAVGARPSTLPVDIDQLVQLASLADELAALPAGSDRVAQIAGALQRMLVTMRQCALDTVFAVAPRIVGDLAHRLGKDIAVETHGGELMIERHVAAGLKAPLLHLVRNAADHGIENAAERVACGKPETGRITIGARRHGGTLVITVGDDGNGLPLAALRRRARELGLASAAVVAEMSDQQVAELIFVAGLSTVAAVNPISGRGIGMAAVRADIAALGGTIAVASRAGLATRFTIVVPLDAATASVRAA